MDADYTRLRTESCESEQEKGCSTPPSPGSQRQGDSAVETTTAGEAVALAFPREVCDAAIHQFHEEFRKYLNFHAILPFLSKYELICSSIDQIIFSDPYTTPESKIDTFLSILPKCIHEDYLSLLVLCLRESAAQAGRPHENLAADIEKFCQIKVQTRSSEEAIGNGRIQEMGTESNSSNSERQSKCWKFCSFKKIAIFCAVAIQFIGFVITLLLLLLRPLNCSTELKVVGSATIPLDSLLQKRFIQSVNVQWVYEESDDQQCGGTVSVIGDKSCPDIPFQVSEERNTRHRHCFIFALPGSTLTISIPDSDSVKNYNVWVTRTLSEYDNIYNQLCQQLDNCELTEGQSMRCEDYDQSCFKTDKYINSSIVFNVTVPGYYCYILTDVEDSNSEESFIGGIQFSYRILTYNYSTIVSSNEYHMIQSHEPVVDNMKPTEVKMTQFFKFHDSTCPLISFDCHEPAIYPKLVINGCEPRFDIMMLIFISGGLLLLVNFISFGTCCCLMKKCSRKSQTEQLTSSNQFSSSDIL